MQGVQPFPDDRMGPDGSYPGEGQRGGDRENCCWKACHTKPAGRIQRDQGEDSGSDRRAETGEEIDLPGAVSEGDEMAEESCQNGPERIAGGVHHAEVEGGRGHLPVVVEPDVRHDRGPIGDQGDEETK